MSPMKPTRPPSSKESAKNPRSSLSGVPVTSTQANRSRHALATLCVLVVIALSTGTAFPQAVTATLTVGSAPAAIAVNPVTGNIYAVNSAGNSVSVINGTTNAVTATVATGTNPVA